jgi:hypothetical protein
LQVCPGSFVPPLQPSPSLGAVKQLHPGRSRRDMDLIAIAVIVALAVVGLAWIAFADRI